MSWWHRRWLLLCMVWIACTSVLLLSLIWSHHHVLAASRASDWEMMPPELPYARAKVSKAHPSSQPRALFDYRNKLLMVSETVPSPNDGGGLRTREVIEAASATLHLQPWVLARAQWRNFRVDELFERLGVHIVASQNQLPQGESGDEADEVRRESLLLGEGFSAPTGSGQIIEDFPALFQLMTRTEHGNASSSLRLVIMAMWSYHTAPSGDPHWTIPELVLPQLKQLPGAVPCAVIMSDDLQHRRFRLESSLTEEQAERLAAREMAAYAAADGVFFVSREDREEVEKTLLKRREQEGIASTFEMPLLITLPYVGTYETAANRTRHVTPQLGLREPLLLYVGSATRSNEQAVSWLVHRVLPILRQARPGLQLTLAGSRQRTYRVPGIRVLGFVDDLDSIIARASVLLLPTFVPSGVATKILSGVRRKKPVVTTSAGRRGIWHANDTLPPACRHESKPLIVRDDPSEYAAAALALLGDRRAYLGIQRCLDSFSDALTEYQQRRAMLMMQDHCLARHPESLGVRADDSKMPIADHSNPQDDKTRLPATAGNVSRPETDRKHSHFPIEPLLVPTRDDITDTALQLTKHASWEWGPGRLRALDLTIVTSFVSKDAQYVLGWFADIRRQRALHVFVMELVVGCFEDDAYTFMLNAINASRGLLGGLARVSVCLFARDPGIYGMWDAIIGRERTAPIVTNWNVDDRKSPFSLNRRLNVLNANLLIDAVTSGVLLFNDSRFTWDGRNLTYTMRLFDLCEDRLLGIQDMFVVHWNASNAALEPRPFVHGSRNVPHNSPMWRKAMHQWIGGFRPKDELGCYDFSFWVRALRRGVRIHHINEPLEMYLSRATSHGHQTHAWESPKWADRWTNECDSRQEWAENHAALLRAVKGKYKTWGQCSAPVQRLYPQVVHHLYSPERTFVLSIPNSRMLCVGATDFRRSIETHTHARIIIWRDAPFKDLMCMHEFRDSDSTVMDGVKWCKWTCNACMLQVSDTGQVFWSNASITRYLFRAWRNETSCWRPKAPLWLPRQTLPRET